MSFVQTEIRCKVEIGSKGFVDFRYSSSTGSAPVVAYETNCQDLLCLGRTVGKIYTFIPNMEGVYVETVGTHFEKVLNSEAVQGIRDSAKDLPDKLKEALGL